jgi:cytoskeletal protein RodZ
MLRGFTKKKVNSLTLGEQLKKLRAEGRVSLHEVSRETKIPVKYLAMIEEGDYKNLPPDVYVKGFLRSYAEFLGVDCRKLIELYLRDKDIDKNFGKNGQEKTIVDTFKKNPVPRFVVTPKMITAALISLVVVGGFYYLYREIGRFAALPRLVVAEPAGDVSIEGSSISVSGVTDQDAKLTINDQPVMVRDSGEFQENILLQEGVNTISISSVNRFGKTATRVLNVKSDYEKPEMAFSENGESDGQVNGEQSEKKSGVEIVVKIDSNPTWLSIESDGNLVYSGTMLPGAVQNFKGEKEVRITSGKANQTLIRVNGGAEKKLADDPGIVRDVVFAAND